MTGARSTDRIESPCLVVLNAAYCSLKLACEPALVSAFWKVPETFRLSNGDLHFPNLWDHGLFKPSTNMVHVIVCVCVRYWYRKQRTCQIKLRSLQSIRLSTSTDKFGRLRTKKGLQGGKTIQQRSEFFASLVPNASTSSLAHALVRSLHTCMCVYFSVSTQLRVAATLLLLLRSWDPWLR